VQQPTGRASAIINLKRDNDIIIKTKTRENSNEKDKRQNKERGSDTNSVNKSSNYSGKPYFRWSVTEHRFEKEPATQSKKYDRNDRNDRNKDEKPVENKGNNIGFYVSKPVNEQKNEKTQKTPYTVNTSYTRTTIINDNKNKPEEKVVKTEVKIVETKKEPPKTHEYKVSYKRRSKNEEKTDDNNRSKVNEEKVEEKKPNINEQKNDDKNNIMANQVKITYMYNRSKLRPNKTDEDLPQKKEREKEQIKVEEKKRRSVATSYIPGSRNILEEKLRQRTYDRKIDDKKPDYKKIEDRKIDDKKPDYKKIDDRKIDDKKPDYKKIDDRKIDDKKTDVRKSDYKIIDDKKPDYKKIEDRKIDDKKPNYKKIDDRKNDDKKTDVRKTDYKIIDDNKIDDNKIDDNKIDDKKNDVRTDYKKIDYKKINYKKIEDTKIEDTKIDDKKNEIDKKMDIDKNRDINNNNNYKYKPTNNRKIIVEERIEEKIEEKPIEENRNETEQKEKTNRLKVALNEIEQVNAERTLKNDLAELFEKVLEHNRDFKNDIFFKNLNDTERKVGNMDNKKIPHTYREIETSKILRNYETAKDLLNKYSQRARRIIEEN